MKKNYLFILVLLSMSSFGQNLNHTSSPSKFQDSLVNKFEFYSFKNEFPILEGKNSVYNLVLCERLGINLSLSFNYWLKKTLIDYKDIDDKPNSKITSELFIQMMGNWFFHYYPKTKELFKGQSEEIKKSIYSIDTKLIKKSFISYDNNEYYIGESAIENGKLIKKGYGAYFFSNGDRYEGFWNNDLKNGEGCMFYKTSGLRSSKKEILYHLNDNVVLKLITFLSSGDIIYNKEERKNNSGIWKEEQVYFNLNKSNPGYVGRYEGDLVNNLPNGDAIKSNYQNGKFISEDRGFFVDGKISVKDKKKPEFIELVSENVREEKEQERKKQELAEDAEKNKKANELDEDFSPISQALKLLSASDRSYHAKVIKMNEDPHGKLGNACGVGIGRCEWCGKSMRYQKNLESRIRTIQMMSNPYVGGYANLVLGFANIFGQALGGKKNDFPLKLKNEIVNELRQIRAGKIYFCSGSSPKYCSPKCEADQKFHKRYGR
jgi:hypothetical protein